VPFQTKSQKAIFCQLSEPITLLVMESLNFVDTIIRGAILTGSFFPVSATGKGAAATASQSEHGDTLDG